MPNKAERINALSARDLETAMSLAAMTDVETALTVLETMQANRKRLEDNPKVQQRRQERLEQEAP